MVKKRVNFRDSLRKKLRKNKDVILKEGVDTLQEIQNSVLSELGDAVVRLHRQGGGASAPREIGSRTGAFLDAANYRIDSDTRSKISRNTLTLFHDNIQGGGEPGGTIPFEEFAGRGGRSGNAPFSELRGSGGSGQTTNYAPIVEEGSRYMRRNPRIYKTIEGQRVFKGAHLLDSSYQDLREDYFAGLDQQQEEAVDDIVRRSRKRI